MRRVFRFWVELLSRKEPATALALFRVAVGLVLAGWILSTVTSDVVRILWLDASHGGYRALGKGNWLLSALGGPVPGVVWPLIGATIGAALCVAAGLGGRLAPLAALAGFRALHTIERDAVGGDDALLTNALWLLALSRAAADWSVDCRLATGQWRRDVEIPAWPRYLAVFQLVVVYTASGLNKLSAGWTPVDGYSALYWVLRDPTWRRFDMDWVAWVYPLTQIGTAVTWHWETSAPLLLLVYWYRETRDRPGRLRRLFNRWDLRIPWALIGVTMHLGILIAFEVGSFSFITLAFYVCLWHPEEIRRRWERVKRKWWGARGREAS